MNSLEKALYNIEFEHANKNIFTEKQLDIIRKHFTQAEQTEKELVTLRKSNDNWVNTVVHLQNYVDELQKELEELKKGVLETTIDLRIDKYIKKHYFQEINEIEELCKGRDSNVD